MTQEELQTAKLLKQWLMEKISGDYKNKLDREERARVLAREYWDKYGYQIIKKAMKQKDCCTIEEFKNNCYKVKRMPAKPPVWTPPT